MTISRQYIADRMFEWPHIKETIFTDTMEGRYNYLDGNRYDQVFANKTFFAAAYPMERVSLAEQGLKDFIENFRVMDHLVCDICKEQTSKGTDIMK